MYLQVSEMQAKYVANMMKVMWLCWLVGNDPLLEKVIPFALTNLINRQVRRLYFFRKRSLHNIFNPPSVLDALFFLPSSK